MTKKTLYLYRIFFVHRRIYGRYNACIEKKSKMAGP